MALLYDVVAILSNFLFEYIPIVCFAGLIVLLVSNKPEKIIMNPYFVFKETTMKKGAVIWGVRAVLLGVILVGYVQWFRYGTRPFIPL